MTRVKRGRSPLTTDRRQNLFAITRRLDSDTRERDDANTNVGASCAVLVHAPLLANWISQRR
jgi:hypothetical protein